VGADSLEFQVWDSDTFPKPDQLLGTVTLSAEEMAAHPEGLQGVLELQGGCQKEQEPGTIEICVQAESGMGQMEMQASCGASAGGVMVASNTQPYPGTMVMAGPTSTYSAVSVPDQSRYSGSPVTYSSFPTTQTITPTTQTMTYGAPQTTYSTSTPQAASMSLVGQPSLTYSTSGQVSQAPQTGSMSMMSQPAMTYGAPSSLGMNQQGGQTGGGKVLQVIVHPPKTVSAQEFAQSNGTIVSTPLPVTSTGTGSALERGIIETGQAIFGTTESGFETGMKLKKTKKQSKSCC